MRFDVGRATAAGSLALMVALVTACGADEGTVPERYGGAPRTAVELYVHCGVRSLDHDGREYVSVDGPLTAAEGEGEPGGWGNPPDGWDNPFQTGWVRVDGDRALFTDDKGHVVEFRLRTAQDTPEKPCA